MKEIKIVAINSNARSGGGKVMLGIAEVARKHGFDYHTYSPEDKKGKFQNHSFIISRIANYINLKISKLIGYDNAIINYGTYKLIRQLKKKRPDIIHLHGLHGWYVDYKMLFKFIRKYDVPVIWTQHDCWAFTGNCTYFSYVNCDKWKTICNDCPQLNSYPESLLIDNSTFMFLLKKKTFTSIKECNIVSVSKWLESKLKESYLKMYPIIAIENGVDTTQFRYIESDLKFRYKTNNKFIILGVAASWSARKGLDSFISLRKLISKEDYEIVLIGLNPEQCKTVKDEGIIGLQRTSSKRELAEWYSAAGVFFNPSIEETFGLVTAEAMACGSPVIVYNSTASPEIVANTNNYIVNVNDLDGVVNCIHQIKENGRKFYSNINRKRVVELYNQENQYEKYINLYFDIIKNKDKNGERYV